MTPEIWEVPKLTPSPKKRVAFSKFHCAEDILWRSFPKYVFSAKIEVYMLASGKPWNLRFSNSRDQCFCWIRFIRQIPKTSLCEMTPLGVWMCLAICRSAVQRENYCRKIRTISEKRSEALRNSFTAVRHEKNNVNVNCNFESKILMWRRWEKNTLIIFNRVLGGAKTKAN